MLDGYIIIPMVLREIRRDMEDVFCNVLQAEDKFRSGSASMQPGTIDKHLIRTMLDAQRRFARRMFQVCKILEGEASFEGPERRDD